MRRFFKRGPARSTEELIKELAAEQPRRRVQAALLLGTSGEAAAEAALVEALADEDDLVRFAAARSLVKIDPTRPPGPLLSRLRAGVAPTDSDPTQLDAEETLRLGLGEMRSLPLFDIFSKGLRSTDVRLRVLSAEMLGRSEDMRAMEPLAAALDDPHRDVRAAAVRAIATLPDARIAGEHLRRVANEGTRLDRFWARRAVRRLRLRQRRQPHC